MRKQYLEGSIEQLILRIVCSGYQGLSITEALSALGVQLKDSGSSSSGPNHPEETGLLATADPPNASAHGGGGSENIWRWIATRPDVFIGRKREWNHLTLGEILALPENITRPATQGADVPNGSTARGPLSSSRPSTRPRLYGSDAKLWECLAGHGEDYQKLPKFEWLALLSIASSMEEGIIQGDLTKLTGQDKRSLPKRTDALAQKGYIEKRPILARGCKTSKLWLKRFAPPAVPVENVTTGKSAADTQSFNLSPEALIRDLEPVPWRTSWTGDTIDYALLVKTIMAVVKAFGVMRYGDLREKLGVAGHAWQMKVVARTCRFLMNADALQYVVANMGSVVFNDCVKFIRDITTEDLARFVTNSGSAIRFGNNQEPRKINTAPRDQIGSIPTDMWDPDKPLTTAVLDVIMHSGAKGVANKGIAFHTLGGYYGRHVAAVGAAVSIKNLQPVHLRRFQTRRVYCRDGRQAAFRLFPGEIAPEPRKDNTETTPATPPTTFPAVLGPGDTEYRFRFVPLTQQSRQCLADGRAKAKDKDESKDNADADADADADASPSPSANASVQKRKRESEPATEETAQPKKKRGRPRKKPPGEEDEDKTGAGKSGSQAKPPTAGATETNIDMAGEGASAVQADVKALGNGKPRGKASKKAQRWVCEKCGGSWKNSLGLKYHQTKARVSCNQSYVDNPPPAPAPTSGPRQAAQVFRGAQKKQIARATCRDRHRSVLASRNWKEEGRHVRGSIQRSDLGNTVTNDIVTEMLDSQPLLGPGLPEEAPPGVPVGGLIESTLAAPRDGPAEMDTQRQRGFRAAPRWPARTGNDATASPSPFSRYSSAPPPPRATPTATSTSSLPSPVPVPNLDQVEAEQPPRTSGVALLPSQEKTSDESSFARQDASARKNGSPVALAPGIPPFQPSAEKIDVDGEARVFGRVRDIIRYLIRVNDDAFPSRNALWYAVVAVYKQSFPEDKMPDSKTTQRVVKDLVRKREVEENTFAFRHSSAGSCSTYLLVKAGVNPNQAKFDPLKSKMKEAYPKPYVPPAFTGEKTAVTGTEKEKTSFRRPGVSSIEVLDAPFYANQASLMRQPSPNPNLGAQASPPPPPPPTPSFHHQPNYSGGTFLEMELRKWAGGLTFYTPNTHLGEGEVDTPASISASASTSTDGPQMDSSVSAFLQARASPKPGSHVPIVFAEPTKIQQGMGAWPDLAVEYFESAGTSFTVKGPFPMPQWTVQPPVSVLGNRQEAHANEASQTQGELWASPVVGSQATQATVRTKAARRSRTAHNAGIPKGKVKGKERMLSAITTTISNGERAGARPLGPSLTEELSGMFGMDEILTAVFVATRTLLGGWDKRLDWGLLCRLLPDMSLLDLRRFWTRLYKNRSHALASATKRFQDALPKAYEQGELPAIDFDDVGANDWAGLVRWTAQLNRDSFIKLPLRRKTGEPGTSRGFVLDDVSTAAHHWHDKFYHPQASVFSRFEMATAGAAALTIDAAATAAAAAEATQGDGATDDSNCDGDPTAAQVAASWVKSLCVTPVAKCPPGVIQAKFSSLVTADINKLLDEVVTDLNLRRIIKKRHRMRPYQLSKPFQSSLAKQSHESKFHAASRFKTLLDETFGRGDHFKVPSLAEDGASMALINLLANDRVRIVGDNIPDIPFGFKPGDYDSRRMAKTCLLFGLHLEPTATYLPDQQIPILDKGRETPAPAHGPGETTPFWYDFVGHVIPSLWVRVLGMVCFILNTRGCMTLDTLYENTQTHLEKFEVRLILHWAQEIGLVTEVVKGGGFMTTEWWWLVVARQRTWLEPVEYVQDRIQPKGAPRKRRGRPRLDENDQTTGIDRRWIGE